MDGLDRDSWTHYCKITYQSSKEVSRMVHVHMPLISLGE